MWSSERVPLTVVVVGPVIATFLYGMVRFQQRLFAFRRNSYTSTGVRVAVVGAGTNGAAALREMQRSPILGLVPVVAVDDDPGLLEPLDARRAGHRVGRRPSAHRRRP